MSLVIRKARPEEVGRFIPLVLEGWSEYAPVLGETCWRQMCETIASFEPQLATGTIFFAERDGELVGCVAYYGPGCSDGVIFPREWGSIRLLAVIPSARGLGLGRQLTERCIEAARADGAEILGLHSNEHMYVARELYTRMGFRIDMDLPEKYGFPRYRFFLRLQGTAVAGLPVGVS